MKCITFPKKKNKDISLYESLAIQMIKAGRVEVFEGIRLFPQQQPALDAEKKMPVNLIHMKIS